MLLEAFWLPDRAVTSSDSETVKNSEPIQVESVWMIENVVGIVTVIILYSNIATQDRFVDIEIAVVKLVIALPTPNGPMRV